MQTVAHQPTGRDIARESQLSHANIVEQLREKNEDGEFVRYCVVEELRRPEGEFRSVLHFGNPHEEDVAVISLASRIGRDEALEILSNTTAIKEMSSIMEYLATCKQSRCMAIIEGETSIGKTLAVATFTQLLWGKNCTPLDFYCKGHSDTSQLLGRWIPRLAGADIGQKMSRLQGDPEARALLEKLGSASAADDQSEFLSLIEGLNQRLGLGKETPWEFQLGAIPKAMQGTKNSSGGFELDTRTPRGFLLHAEEVGLAEPAIIDAFLQCRGKRAKLADTIQLWENDGRIIQRGEDYLIVMSTNPPESYPNRNEIDPSLTRNAEVLRLGHLCSESLKRMARDIFTFSLPDTRIDTPPVWGNDIRNARELGRAVASVMALFHEKAVEVLKGGEPGRVQRTIPTIEDFDRVRSRIVREQIMTTGASGILEIDIVKTLTRAVERVYIGRLANEKKKGMLRDTFSSLMSSDDLGREDFRGTLTPRNVILTTLCREFVENERKNSQAPVVDLAGAVLSAQTLAQQEQARQRWGRLASRRVLPALESGTVR